MSVGAARRRRFAPGLRGGVRRKLPGAGRGVPAKLCLRSIKPKQPGGQPARHFEADVSADFSEETEKSLPE